MATAKQNTSGTTGSLQVSLSEPGTTQTVKVNSKTAFILLIQQKYLKLLKQAVFVLN